MKPLKIKMGEWPSITSRLMMAFGAAIGLKSFVDSYNYYTAGQETWALGSLAMGALIIFMYFFNYRLIDSMSKCQFRVYIARYKFEQFDRIVAMEAELVMRRSGLDVPENMLAHVNAIDGYSDHESIGHGCESNKQEDQP